MLTIAECKSIIFKACIETGANPKKVSTMLLSPEDKQDMLDGLLSYETLCLHVKLWSEQGCPDLVNI